MTRTILSPRARGPRGRAERALGHPVALVATAAALLLIFSWTFIVDPGRVAPGDDPAFYTWRTEALLSEEPATILDTTGPQDVLTGGYRVTTPVLGGILRRTLGIAPETTTIILTVGVRVLIALLLAGFAFRHREDPLVFHAVAFGSAGLLLTPPFFGYLDNLLCLLFLTSSLFFLERLRASWGARVVFFVLLFLAGLTHPTTLLFFCLVLGAMAALRLVTRRFDVKSVVHDDLPGLASAFLAAVAVVAVWRLGAWGPAVALSEAAVPPPAGADFFSARLGDWVAAMRPLLNGPLLVAGVAAVAAGDRRDLGENELRRVALVWLVPLVGVFGFAVGLAYPYYRFFNTTLAWVLLVGVGAAAAIRYFIARARTAGPVALVGVVGVAAVLVTNFASGYPRWNDADEAWLTAAQQTEFAAVRNALEQKGDGRPVVFVVDTSAAELVRVYGFMKLAANSSRHALPHGYLDRGHVYLGDVPAFLERRATPGPNDDYRALSQATLDDAPEEAMEPLVIVARSLNTSGANARLFDAGTPRPPRGVWIVSDASVTTGGNAVAPAPGAADASVARIAIAGAGLLLLCVIGALAAARLPDVRVADVLGLVPALTMAFVTVTGFVVLAIARAPLSSPLAWWSVAVAAGGAWLLRMPREAP